MQTAVEVRQFTQLSQWAPTFGFRNHSLLPIVNLAGKCLVHHEFCSRFLGYTLNGHSCGAGGIHIFSGSKADERNTVVYGSVLIACTPPEQMSRWKIYWAY
jgi:hypothetical protein